MDIKKVIVWCNDNVGFATIILALLTLVVSVIAIIVSIRTSRLPYKKRLLLEAGSFFGIGYDSNGIYINAVNIGNRAVKISKIGLLINKQYVINANTIKESQITLHIGDTTSQYFEYKNLKQFKKLHPLAKVCGYVEDTEGKKYKKHICRIYKITK